MEPTTISSLSQDLTKESLPEQGEFSRSPSGLCEDNCDCRIELRTRSDPQASNKSNSVTDTYDQSSRGYTEPGTSGTSPVIVDTAQPNGVAPGTPVDYNWPINSESKKKRRKQQAFRKQSAWFESSERKRKVTVANDSFDPKRMKIQGSDICRDTMMGRRLAIVTVDFPSSLLTTSDLYNIQKLITDKLFDLTEAPLPRCIFTNVVVNGAVLVNCDTDYSEAFLKENIDGKSVGNVRLKIINSEDLPKPVKMAWKMHNMTLKDTPRALKMLQLYNPTLRTGEWKVVDTLIEESTIRRIVYMDGISAEVIKEANYRLYGGTEICKFKLMEPYRGENVQASRSGRNNACVL